MDHTLDYQSRDRKIDPSLLRLLTEVPFPYEIVVGGTEKQSSLTHSLRTKLAIHLE